MTLVDLRKCFKQLGLKNFVKETFNKESSLGNKKIIFQMQIQINLKTKTISIWNVR